MLQVWCTTTTTTSAAAAAITTTTVCGIGLVEVLWKRESGYAALLNAVLLAKCIQAHVWENSHYVSKQLTGIGQSEQTA